MSKLVITDTEGRTYDYELGKERVTIGRLPGNDVVLADKAVSGRHAVIVTILQDSFLEDLGSTNGCQVNGQAVRRHALAHGDLIGLGRNTLRFLGNPQEETADDRTMILRPGQRLPNLPPLGAPAPRAPTPPSAAAARPMPAPAAAAPRPPLPALGAASLASTGKPVLGKLRVSSGPNLGRELELTKPLTTLGRPGVQVAAITRRADGYYIVQVGASQGKRLMLNGREVDDQAHKLNDQDHIELAGTRMQYLRIS